MAVGPACTAVICYAPVRHVYLVGFAHSAHTMETPLWKAYQSANRARCAERVSPWCFNEKGFSRYSSTKKGISSIVQKPPARHTRVSGVSDTGNSRQNDERAKTRNTDATGSRKERARVGDDSDRKHLTGRELERLIEATKGSRNEARSVFHFLLS
jgi:hypothetical protein